MFLKALLLLVVYGAALLIDGAHVHWSTLDVGAATRCGLNGAANVSRYVAYLQHHNKSVEEDHLCFRAAVLRANTVVVERMNADPHDNAEYSAFHSPFGDLEPEEFASKYLMRSTVHQSMTGVTSSVFEPGLDATPVREKDWTAIPGVVSPVRDQGTLGTCYAYSAAGVVEGQLAIHSKRKATTISVEHVLECDAGVDPKADAAVCGEFGGWPYLVLDYWSKNGGAVEEKDWPYCAGTIDPKSSLPMCFPCMPHNYSTSGCGEHDDLYCQPGTTAGQGSKGRCTSKSWIQKHRVAVVDGWDHYGPDEVQLAAAVAEKGPLSATLDAFTLQFYRKGIANPYFCRKDTFNHSVLLVGFGEEGGKEFWKAKASWGTKYGERGYFRIRRNKDKCGINRAVVGARVKSIDRA
mmetsp:Transcript_20958/g.37128  ORF Transcript_20958/g.37128 Transcript_20958/m.37128 type:complete len:407 (-) Transcript_20958:34-1254(-)